jgi:hypothetical protein
MKKIFLSLLVLGVIFVGTVSAVDKTTVTINDIVVKGSTKVTVWILKEPYITMSDESTVALGEGLIKKGVLEVALNIPSFKKDRFDISSKMWENDGGDYYIALLPAINNTINWNNTVYYTANGLKLVKYSLKGNAITLSYNDFKSSDDMNAHFFEGEFRNMYEDSKEVYIFKGNRWQFTNKDNTKTDSGTYELKGGEIIFYMENGKKWRNVRYRINDVTFQTYISNDNAPIYLKQPVEAFANSGKLVTQFQGTWIAPEDASVTYTFSGNKFTHVNSKNTIEGTFEANSRIIKLTTPNGYTMLTYEFIDGKLSLGWITKTNNLAWYYGTFNKQK